MRPSFAPYSYHDAGKPQKLSLSGRVLATLCLQTSRLWENRWELNPLKSASSGPWHVQSSWKLSKAWPGSYCLGGHLGIPKYYKTVSKMKKGVWYLLPVIQHCRGRGGGSTYVCQRTTLKSLFSFHHVGFRDWTQVIRMNSKHLCLLIHFLGQRLKINYLVEANALTLGYILSPWIEKNLRLSWLPKWGEQAVREDGQVGPSSRLGETREWEAGRWAVPWWHSRFRVWRTCRWRLPSGESLQLSAGQDLETLGVEVGAWH